MSNPFAQLIDPPIDLPCRTIPRGDVRRPPKTGTGNTFPVPMRYAGAIVVNRDGVHRLFAVEVADFFGATTRQPPRA